jgi:PiT family inorganic phosphate transporter
MFFFFLMSGLFLGWSLGANDAANVYGTAVGTKMIKFRTAAITCGLFVLIGAVIGGAGASHTLGKLGAVNALPGSFAVALAAGLTVTWMTRLKLPVSTSQAVVGAIIGWNFFSGTLTDVGSLTKIVSSWILCPILAALFAMALFKLAQLFLHYSKLHMLRLDVLTRYGLLLVGAFASYSLGANNIANVMGVFVPAAPFNRLDIFGVISLSPAQQLFFLGALAIGVGVLTYSKKVMLTVGSDLFRLSPIAALLVVLAQALVLFLFSSEELETWLILQGLPTIPLVPVSSSQAVIGAVIGIGIAKGGRNIQFRVLGRIASGWISTPIIAGFISFVLLFIVQNVFSQEVYDPIRYRVSVEVVSKLRDEGLYNDTLDELLDIEFENAVAFRRALASRIPANVEADQILSLAEVRPLEVDIERLEPFYDYQWYTEEQISAVFRLHGRRFTYRWQLRDALEARSPAWRPRSAGRENKHYNNGLRERLEHLYFIFNLPSNGERTQLEEGSSR